MDNQLHLSMIINFVIFILALFSTIWMMSGITVSSKTSSLTASRLKAFMYFTVDSNVFAGIISFVLFLYLYQHQNITELPHFIWILKLMATSGVTLTLLVTCCYLAPTSKHGFLALFRNSNFFFHLIIPLLSIFSFILLEKQSDVSYLKSLYGLVPTLVYAVYYLNRCFSHIENGEIDAKYDFYRFFQFGSKTIPLVLLILFAVNELFCLALVFFNRL